MGRPPPRAGDGKIARQADGAVLATYGETTVLCTAVAAKSAKPGQDFFPLTVNYQEKTFAAGKIPGGFFKREGRPSEKETLTSRLIDRPIRPLFVSGFRNETQVVCTVLSHDLENDPDVVALVGASAALTISGIPFMGPIAGCRVGYIDGQYVLNPTIDQLPRSQLDLLVAGTGEGVLMVESEAKELSEEIMLGAVTFGHQSFQPVINAIIELAETCAKEPWTLAEPPASKAAVEQRLREAVGPQIEAAYRERNKQARSNQLDAAKASAAALFDDEGEQALALKLFKDIEKEIVRGAILRDGQRIDGRDTQDGAADRLPGRPAAAGARLGAVHPRRNPGGRRRHPGHRPGRADHRRAGRRVPRKLHAALQFPALLDRRGRPDGLARTPRDRPRQARLAGGAAAVAAEGELPLHDPHRVGDHRIERLVVDGLGVRRLAGADGCRRAAGAAGRRHRDGADQGAAGASPCCPTSSATRTISATWTSRWPAPSAASPRCRWTSRSPRSPRRSCGSRSTRRATAAATSSARWRRR